MAFFQVLRPNGEVAYTRAGAFKLDSAGNLVTSSGYPLEPPITVPADTEAISIGGDGTVAVIVAGETEPQEIGQIAQGVLELSNVEVVEEMVNMITAQRAYEANSHAIKIADDMLQMANNVNR